MLDRGSCAAAFISLSRFSRSISARGCRGVSTKPRFPAKMGAMGIRLATWNVNSLRQRLDHLARFAAEAAPDVICLQETKVTDALFPREALQAMGYPHLLVHG